MPVPLAPHLQMQQQIYKLRFAPSRTPFEVELFGFKAEGLIELGDTARWRNKCFVLEQLSQLLMKTIGSSTIKQ